MESERPNNKILKRSAVVCAVIVTLLLLLCLRIFAIQIFDFDEYEQKVIDQITQTTPVSADRGEIYDTNGIVIATNITTYRLFIDPAVISKQTTADAKNYASIIAEGLSAIPELELTYDGIMKQTEYTRYRDRTLKKHITEEMADKVRLFLEEKELDDLALVHLQATSKRYYPYDELGSHILGFTNSDGSGVIGIEAKYNEELSGTDGKYITAKDSAGNKMPYDYESYIPAVDGYSIVTTIDVYIQAELEEQVKQAYINSDGQNRASGIVMDVNTGAVLGMATYPNFDLNDPWKLNDYVQAELDESGFEEGSDEYEKLKGNLLNMMWNNKAITELYMPGSTFKVVTAAMAYEENLVKEGETFSCPGYHIVAGQKIKCHKISGHGTLTFPEGLYHSCNPALMMIGARIGQNKFYDYFNAFGYMKKTGVDLPGEAYTSVKGQTFWEQDVFMNSDIYLATASFGQNFKVSLVSHITAISAVANGGYLMQPHLVKEIRDNDGNVIYSYEPQVQRQVISEDTSRTVSSILKDGVENDGGAKNVYVAGYRIAAKTGTSEKKDVFDTEYTPYVCSTVAYAPADAPRISAIIMVDEPTAGTLYGSVVAAPYVGKLMEEVLPYIGVEAVFSEEELKAQAIETPWLTALTVERAQELAALYGVSLDIVGDGDKVLAQSPAPLTQMEKGSAKVVLYTTEESKNNRRTVIVPDLMNMTAVASNGTLVGYGLNIKISGTKNYMSGTGAVVYEQSIPPGTEVEIGTVVELRFRYLDGNDMT